VRVLEPLRTVTATRYAEALREGGSLPGLLEADDDGMYVTKFRGAGQGEKALVAEVVAGELARSLGLPVPELVVVDVDPALGAAEPDPEIQELIEASPGLNLGMDFLPGALPYTAGTAVDPALAADIVWFDALITNVDRTHRNPNLLVWHKRLWLIDHGAAFFRQHGHRALSDSAHEPMPAPMLAEHVLLAAAGSIEDADERLGSRALAAVGTAVARVPPQWLGANPASRRGDFAAFLTQRLARPRSFLKEIERARG
jgi:HipA-like protein